MSEENVQFRVAHHSVTGGRIVEVWNAEGTALLGVIYPTSSGIKFVSKYITNHPHLVVIDPAEPPAVLISLEKEPSQ
jgi:hypothetical protein